jgi:phosphopantothenate synthetase
MLVPKQFEVAETVFDRNKRREAEINEALKQEVARHEAAVKNMHRLRALRLQRDKKSQRHVTARAHPRRHVALPVPFIVHRHVFSF